MTPLVLACVALAFSAGARPDDARQTCGAIEALAPLVGQDAWEMAALSWHESKFSPSVVSRSGCVGPMQVNPSWSPYTRREIATYEGGVVAGLLAVEYWQARRGEKWMHCYNSGNTCHAPGYVRQVKRAQGQLKAWARILGGGS